MPNIDDIQVKAQIAFFLAVIAFVLVYLVFGRNIRLKGRSKKSSKRK